MPEETKSPAPPPTRRRVSRRVPWNRFPRQSGLALRRSKARISAPLLPRNRPLLLLPRNLPGRCPFPGILRWLRQLKADLRLRYSRSKHLPRAELHDCQIRPPDCRRCCRSLRDEEEFDYCVDITALHYPQREKQFDLIWILYSFARNERIRVKTHDRRRRIRSQSASHLANCQLAGAGSLRHVRHQFDGHPDLKRILLARWLEGTSAAQGLRHHSAG